MLGCRGIVQYEPVALGFTVVPERLDRLLSQRSRWARGMLEGLQAHSPPKQPRVLAKVVAGIDHVLMSAAALRGYGQSIVGSNRRWK